MKRRDFLKKLSVLPIVGLAISYLASCDNSGSSSNGNNSGQSTPNPTPTPTPAPTPNPTPGPTPGQGQACLNGGQSTVLAGGNPSHTHPSTNIAAGDVAAGTTQNYAVPAENGHSHSFTLQATHYAMMRANGSVTLLTDSDGTGHFHAITITCN